jgi:hypothetical protein
MLALSSASLRLREARFAPRTSRDLGPEDVGDSSFVSVANACVLATESCVVALERSCGLADAVECDVEGRESRPSAGRGGSGGGVSSLDSSESTDVLREKFRIILRVGLAKSCCSIGSPVVDLAEALLLFCVGVVGELGPSAVGVWGSAFPVSAIKTAVEGHLDSGLVCVMTWRVSTEACMSRSSVIVTLIQVAHHAWTNDVAARSSTPNHRIELCLTPSRFCKDICA